MLDLLLTVLPLLAFAASLILLVLGTFQLVVPSFIFWPPPKDQPWKKWLFMTLFRIVVYGLAIASALHIWQNGLQLSRPAAVFAMSLFIVGFGIAFASTGVLGWSNAFGTKDGLRTDGIFQYSRNPIYIATWFGLAGWALLIPIPVVVATLLIWALLYVVAIFLEEKWLAQEYGEPFHEYCRKVRRFL